MLPGAKSLYSVQRQIPGRGSGLDAKARNQVLTAYLPDEAHAQLHEREPVAFVAGLALQAVRSTSWLARSG